MSIVSIVTQFLSVMTIFGQIVILAIFAAFIFRKKFIIKLIGRNAVLFSLIISTIATTGSLFFSEIALFEPCKLCWYQRIFMYPQTVILGMALWKKDYRVADFSLVFSIFGAAVAAYHYLTQIGAVSITPCSAIGYAASCSERFIMQFGYITIPMMSLTAFILIFVFMLIYKNEITLKTNKS